MKRYVCIQKIRDSKNNILGYHLKDESGHVKQVMANELKRQIKSGNAIVENLTLTSDGRLVDGAEEKEKHVQEKQPTDIDRKIMNYIEACKVIGIKPLDIDKIGEDYVIVGLPNNEKNIQIPDFVTGIRVNSRLNGNDNQYINKFTSFEIEKILKELLNRVGKNDDNQITIEDIQNVLSEERKGISEEHKEIEKLINEKIETINKDIEENIKELTVSLEELGNELKTDNDETLKEMIEFMKSGDAQVAIKKAEVLKPAINKALNNIIGNERAYVIDKSKLLPEDEKDLLKKLDGENYELHKLALESEERYNSIRERYTACANAEECEKSIRARRIEGALLHNKLDCELTGNCNIPGKSYAKINLGCEVNIEHKEDARQYINYTCNYFLELYNMLTREFDIRQDVNMADTQVYMDTLTAVAGYTLGMVAFTSNLGGVAADIASNKIKDSGAATIAYGKTATGASGVISGAINTGKALDKLLARSSKKSKTLKMIDKTFKNMSEMQDDINKYADADIFRFTVEYIYSESKTFSREIGKPDSKLFNHRGLLHKEILKTVNYLKRDKSINGDMALSIVVAYLAAYLYIKHNFNFVDNYTPEYIQQRISECKYKDNKVIFERHKLMTVLVREYMLFNLHVMGVNSNFIYGKLLNYFNMACRNCDMHIVTIKPSKMGVDVNMRVASGADPAARPLIKVRELLNED